MLTERIAASGEKNVGQGSSSLVTRRLKFNRHFQTNQVVNPTADGKVVIRVSRSLLSSPQGFGQLLFHAPDVFIFRLDSVFVKKKSMLEFGRLG